MNAEQIYKLVDGDYKACKNLWACGSCGILWTDKNAKDSAESCCNRRCDTEGCTEPLYLSYIFCATHYDQHAKERHQKLIDEAIEIDGKTFEGMVYLDANDHPAVPYDGIYSSDFGEIIAELGRAMRDHDDYEGDLDEYEYPETQLPSPFYCWATNPIEFKIDASTLLEHATENLYEDAYDSISYDEINRLQAFLDDWCKTNDPGGIEPDYTRKIRIN